MTEQIIPISYKTEVDVARFDTALTERLRRFLPQFTEMGGKLIEGDELSVGFGCLPKAHGDCTLGIATRLGIVDGAVSYRAPSHWGLEIDIDLPDNERWRIIEMPNVSKKHPFVVSVYLKTDSNFGMTYVDTKVLTAPEDVIVGVVSHELSELRTRFGAPLSPEALELIKLYKDQRNRFNLKDILPATEREVEFDIVASALGFRDRILAVRSFNIDRLGDYNKTTKTGRGYDIHIAQQEFRRDVVTRLTS